MSKKYKVRELTLREEMILAFMDRGGSHLAAYGRQLREFKTLAEEHCLNDDDFQYYNQEFEDVLERMTERYDDWASD